MSDVDIGKPNTWLKYREGLCQGCWSGCCHSMPVEVSVPDLIRMGVLTEDEAAGSLKRAARRLKREGIVRIFRAGALIFVLEQRGNGDCIYLNSERTCSIYERRPEICRQFPKIGPRPGYCPSFRK